VSRAFAAGQRFVVRVRLPAATIGAQTSVVGHEQDDRAVGKPVTFDIGQDVSQRFIHPLDHSRVHGFRVVQTGIAIRLVEPRIDGKRNMHGVMRHVEKERPAFGYGLIHRLVGFDRQCFRQEDVLSVILLQVGHIPDAIAVSPGGTEILGSQKAPWTARGVPPNVDFKADVPRIASRCSHRPEVRLADVDRTVARFPQKRRQRAHVDGPFDARLGTEAIDIPCRKGERRVTAIVARVLVQRPVRHSMPGGVEPGHQTDPGRRANAARIRLREFHACASEALHVGCAITAIQLRHFRVKRHRGVLPAHVVDQKQDDIGLLRQVARAGHASTGLRLSHRTGSWENEQQERDKYSSA